LLKEDDDNDDASDDEEEEEEEDVKRPRLKACSKTLGTTVIRVTRYVCKVLWSSAAVSRSGGVYNRIEDVEESMTCRTSGIPMPRAPRISHMASTNVSLVLRKTRSRRLSNGIECHIASKRFHVAVREPTTPLGVPEEPDVYMT
jgi:hypothetical protein